MNNDLLNQSATKVKAMLDSATCAGAVLLGSGWGSVLDIFKLRKSVSYNQIPCMGTPEVSGHAGMLHTAEIHGATVLVFQGRRHWYEGAGWEPVAFPVFLASQLKADFIVLTNAAGSIRADMKPGDLMLITDHINAMGANPLQGPHHPFWGPRFPDLSRVYDPALNQLLLQAAAQVNETLHQGVYLATSGPTYETPAEVSAFRTLGADALGMSTVPEAILARAAGLRVVGISCITNRAAGLSAAPLSHEEVLETTRLAAARMQAVLGQFFRMVTTAR